MSIDDSIDKCIQDISVLENLMVWVKIQVNSSYGVGVSNNSVVVSNTIDNRNEYNIKLKQKKKILLRLKKLKNIL